VCCETVCDIDPTKWKIGDIHKCKGIDRNMVDWIDCGWTYIPRHQEIYKLLKNYYSA